ncbi:MAG: hypothetical protein AVDCRST_MAG43-1139 [uncultured Thermomicrobiales bacterium]|uniref:Uncharacterized protein n=1 Tax=uncultured Thermomicrobiales bacterium TaxID=1645740 RepID=A0A6J4UM36_9BACT|nr:MAG: hypothetical protein AVDCRST_MAG43-1139 [uncultured Thermomicrobiales bacterium]
MVRASTLRRGIHAPCDLCGIIIETWQPNVNRFWCIRGFGMAILRDPLTDPKECLAGNVT